MKEIPRFDSETSTVRDAVYDMDIIKPMAEQIPVEHIPLTRLLERTSEGNYYWNDKQGKRLGPAQLLKDWEAAQHNPDWADHVQGIQRADMDEPLWMTREGHVFNGMHRLTRHILEKSETVPVRIFDELPEEAKVDKQ